jgi:DNA integrity scanning protein DisA with diadenylate cyclase activity
VFARIEKEGVTDIYHCASFSVCRKEGTNMFRLSLKLIDGAMVVRDEDATICNVFIENDEGKTISSY